MSTLEKYKLVRYRLKSKFLESYVRKTSVSIPKKDVDLDLVYGRLLNLIQANIIKKYALGFMKATAYVKNRYGIDIEIIETDTQFFVWTYTYISIPISQKADLRDVDLSKFFHTSKNL